jgi:hypothetical protein
MKISNKARNELKSKMNSVALRSVVASELMYKWTRESEAAEVERSAHVALMLRVKYLEWAGMRNRAIESFENFIAE